MHCRPYKVNNFAVLNLIHHLAVEQGKINEYSLFIYPKLKKVFFYSERGERA